MSKPMANYRVTTPAGTSLTRNFKRTDFTVAIVIEDTKRGTFDIHGMRSDSRKAEVEAAKEQRWYDASEYHVQNYGYKFHVIPVEKF